MFRVHFKIIATKQRKRKILPILKIKYIFLICQLLIYIGKGFKPMKIKKNALVIRGQIRKHTIDKRKH